MRKWIVVSLLLVLGISPALGAVKTLQVTLGSGNTAVLSAGAHLNCRWIVFQDNATHVMRIGDTNISSTRGLLLASGSPGGSFFVGPDTSGTGKDLGSWYVNGTNGDVIDIIYDDGQ